MPPELKLLFTRNCKKLALAPMVRAGTLPFRLLCLHYGADVVYSDEIIDHKLLKAKRTHNVELGCIDYVLPSQEVVYRTCDAEKGKNILQLGTNSPERSLKVAKMLEKDIAGIDINMGCPKHFSIQGGMGAALLKTPDIAENIIRTLSENLSIPVTCKIRLLEADEDTVKFVKRMEAAGAKAIGVHMRYKEQRSTQAAHRHKLKQICEAVSVPIIANGDIISKSDAEQLFEETGASAVMFARSALRDAAIFSGDHNNKLEDIVRKYLEFAALTENNYKNTKYTISQMVRYGGTRKFRPEIEKIKIAKSAEILYNLFEMSPTWESRSESWPLNKIGLDDRDSTIEKQDNKRKKHDQPEIEEAQQEESRPKKQR